MKTRLSERAEIISAELGRSKVVPRFISGVVRPFDYFGNNQSIRSLSPYLLGSPESNSVYVGEVQVSRSNFYAIANGQPQNPYQAYLASYYESDDVALASFFRRYNADCYSVVEGQCVDIVAPSLYLQSFSPHYDTLANPSGGNITFGPLFEVAFQFVGFEISTR